MHVNAAATSITSPPLDKLGYIENPAFSIGSGLGGVENGKSEMGILNLIRSVVLHQGVANEGHVKVEVNSRT